ncbi:MAG: hypothetical protein IBX58_17110 [Roseovarius sp.]|nr:hypothetical protein [Roseovarius sp.]
MVWPFSKKKSSGLPQEFPFKSGEAFHKYQCKFGQAIYLCGALLLPVLATAQTASERAAEVSGEDFVRAFLGNCAQNAGNFNIVISAAEAFGFADLPDEMKPLLAPQDPHAEFVGYYAQSGDGAPYFLGVAKGDLDGRSFTNCSIANPYIETAQVVSALQDLADTGAPDHDETAMGQRYRVWFVNEWSQDAFISLTDAEPMGYGGATLTMSAPSIN